MTDVEKLRKLAAIAINQLAGPVVFDAVVSGEQLRNVAIQSALFTFDNAHHAPKCPANHYHQRRLPTGGCTCGAALTQPDVRPDRDGE